LHAFVSPADWRAAARRLGSSKESEGSMLDRLGDLVFGQLYVKR